MLGVNITHHPGIKSWVSSANTPGCDFPLQNLPFAVFRRAGTTEAFRGGVAIGDKIIDLKAASEAGCFSGAAASAALACSQTTLNAYFELGPEAWSALRHALFALLRQEAHFMESAIDLRACLVSQAEVEYSLPVHIGDYTDYFTSIHHAVNSGRLFKPNIQLPASFKWIPMAYHGRVSTIDVSGHQFRRPHGQVLPPGSDTPEYRPSARLDFELELGVFIGTGNAAGERIELSQAESHVFGLCMLNDWSARDIQAWEMTPLGPFHAKNFATTISPWIVSMEALAPYRKPLERPKEDPPPLPYLHSDANRDAGALDIQLEVAIETQRMRNESAPASVLSRTTFAHQYWTVAQMVTHHAAGGCSLRSGDLLGTGTISGPTRAEAGALMELSLAGREPIALGNGESRGFLEDGDEVVFKGWCERPGFVRIGFGRNFGRVLPAL